MTNASDGDVAPPGPTARRIPQPLRVSSATWAEAKNRIDVLKAPVMVTVTARPGDSRNGAIEAFLRALLDATEPESLEGEQP